MVGFQEGVKDYIGKYGVVVIEMVVGCILGVDKVLHLSTVFRWAPFL